MIIPIFVVKSLAEYQEKYEQIEVPRPEGCGRCRWKSALWRHGSFNRTATEGEIEVRIKVQRFLCPACGRTASCLFAFLIPYRRFTAAVFAEAVSSYSTKETSYRQLAGGLSALVDSGPPKPSHSQVFGWVKNTCRKVESLLLEIQKELVMTGRTDDVEQLRTRLCPNAKKAKTEAKVRALNHLSELVSATTLLLANNNLAELHTHFLQCVESLQEIFTQRAFELATPQRTKHGIF
jgi:transposase-like protein